MPIFSLPTWSSITGLPTSNTELVNLLALYAELDSPSFTTPDIGVANGTSLALDGLLTYQGSGSGPVGDLDNNGGWYAQHIQSLNDLTYQGGTLGDIANDGGWAANNLTVQSDAIAFGNTSGSAAWVDVDGSTMFAGGGLTISASGTLHTYSDITATDIYATSFNGSAAGLNGYAPGLFVNGADIASSATYALLAGQDFMSFFNAYGYNINGSGGSFLQTQYGDATLLITPAQFITSNTSISTPGYYVITGTTASQTVTLPASSDNGRIISIKNRSNQTWTIASATGSQIYTTSAVATTTLAAGDSIELRSDGTYWNKF